MLSAAQFLDMLGASIRNCAVGSPLRVWIALSGALRAAACRALDTLDF